MIIGASFIIQNAFAPVLQDHAVIMADGYVQAVLPLRYRDHLAGVEWDGQWQPVDFYLENHVLAPGFVNTHTHAAMTLFRGFADDLPLKTWLQEKIWPLEQRFVSEEMVYDGTLLAAAEMLRAGTTTFTDMYFFPEEARKAAQNLGIRAILGLVVMDVPTPYAENAKIYLERAAALLQENKALYYLAPHAPYTVTDDTLIKIRNMAHQYGCPIGMHVHETDGEVKESLAGYGIRPIERLKRLGLFDMPFLSVHSVHVDEEEIALFAEKGVSIAHCPASNLKLASGIAPLHTMKKHGVRISIGTDGAASNNTLDMVAEMRLASLLAKVSGQAATAFPAKEAFYAATEGGAKALGLDDVGCIEKGFYADIVAFDYAAIETLPLFDPLAQIVYTAPKEAITHVWVNGNVVLKDRMLQNITMGELRMIAENWQRRFLKESL